MEILFSEKRKKCGALTKLSLCPEDELRKLFYEVSVTLRPVIEDQIRFQELLVSLQVDEFQGESLKKFVFVNRHCY